MTDFKDATLYQRLANRGGTGIYGTDAYRTGGLPYFPGDGTTDVSGRLASLFNDTMDAEGGAAYLAPGRHYMGANLTLSDPNNVALGQGRALVFQPGAVLVVPAGVTLTINAPIVANPQMIFSGAGTVLLGKAAAPDGIRSEWFGALWDGTTDDTDAHVKALGAGKAHAWPAGTSVVSSIPATVLTNKKIRTEGVRTILQQKAGTAAATRMLCLGSDVEIGDLTVKGNIAADRVISAVDEQKHAVFIYADTAAVTGVSLGRIVGYDICGDVVYAGGTYGVSGLSVRAVEGNNILRNVVSLTSAQNTWIGSITTTGAGLCTFDIEPNSGFAPCYGIRVDYIRGGRVQVDGQSGSITGDVSFGFLDLNPAYQPTSVPDYTNALLVSYHDVSNAVVLQNHRSVQIDHLRTSGFNACSITCLAGVGPSGQVKVGYFTCLTGSLTDTTFNALIAAAGTNHLVIEGFEVVLGSAAKCLVQGLSSGVPPAISTTRVECRNGTINGGVARYCDRSTFENVTVNGTLTNAYAFTRLTNSKVSRCSIVTPRLAGLSNNIVFEQCSGTFTGFLFDDATNSDHTLIDCTFDGTYHRLTTWKRNYLNATRFGNPLAGGYAQLWVDANGKWRSKITAPTSDTDGYIIETIAKRLTADVAITASGTVALSGLDVALAANSGTYVFDYELAADVTAGTAGLKPVITLPGAASGRISASGHVATTASAPTLGASSNNPANPYATAFATASLTGAVIRIRLVVVMSGTSGNISIGLVTGASAAGNVLQNSSVTVSRV